MRPDTDAYFKLTNEGESRWWSWGIVFWFTVLGWLAAQLFITSPVGPLLQAADPELSKEMMEASMAAFTGDNMATMAIMSATFGLSSILGIIFWISHRAVKKVPSQGLLITSIIMFVIAFLSLIPIFLILIFTDAKLTSEDIRPLLKTCGSFSLLCIFIGAVFLISNKTTLQIAKRINGVLCGLMVVTSLVSFAKLIPLMSTPELTQLNPKIVAASPVIFMLILLTFPGALVAPYLGQKFIHNRTIKSLHTAASNIRWNRGLQAFFVTWAVLGTITAILHFTGISPVRSNLGAQGFIAYSLVCLLFLPLQSGTEEIIFRGYLNQGFNHLLKNKWVTFIITSLLFMAMHLANPEALAGKESGMLTLTMSHYFLFGFIACLMVWMDDGLESAIGFHAANNTFAGIFVNYEGSVIPTPSLFMATSNPKIDVFVGLATLGLIAAIMWKTRKPLT